MAVWIRPRPAKKPRSFQVLFRRGGRGFRIECAGTFGAKKDAEKRRTVVAGWLASGADPVTELGKLQNPPERRRFHDDSARYRESLVDLGERSQKVYGFAVAFWDRALGNPYTDEMDEEAIQAAISAATVSAKTLRTYRSILRGIFDYAKVKPNPARSELLRWPRIDEQEINPPEAAQVDAILARVSKRLRLPLVVAERCALRIGEIHALEWGDVDETGCRFRLRRQTTKGGKARWVPVEPWLMAVIADTCPREDRTPTRRVFQGLSESTARDAMERACRTAGIPHFHPHDFRHRRISLWFVRSRSPT